MSEISNNSIEIPESSENADYEKHLIFTIMGKLYSFPSRFIGEIALYDSVYPLPLMPSFVLGVVNRYSIPYALFDIGLLFYKMPSQRNKILIFKDEIDKIAVLIEDVSGIIDIQHDEIFKIEKTPDSNDITDVVSASFKMNDKDVFVLDIHKIIARAAGETL